MKVEDNGSAGRALGNSIIINLGRQLTRDKLGR